MEIISRKHAIAKGLNKYFEGKPCKRGHIDFRWVNGGCNSCLNERKKERRTKNAPPKEQGPKLLSYGPFLSSKEAKAQGLNRYYTGICFKCGSAEGSDFKACIRCRRVSSKQWRLKNPEKYELTTQRYRRTEKSKTRRIKWVEKNKLKLREQNKLKEQRYRDQMKTRAIVTLIRNRVHAVLRDNKKSERTIKLIGVVDWQDIRDKIEAQWEEGMNWDNWTKYGWHLDHVRPCASFNLSDPDQQKVCFNWRNLQPLWGEENWSKLDKYEPEDEVAWVERMISLGYKGELFLKYEEGNSY